MTKIIASRITKLREERGWSRYRLSKQSGVSYSYLTALEEGDHSPSLDVLEKIAAGLEIELVDLFKEDERMVTNETDFSKNSFV